MASAPERRPAALLYAELRNFTRLSEVLQPDKVLALANEFFALAARAFIANAGRVLSVQNDSLLGAFTEGEPREFVDRALKAAQAVQTEFGALGERWQKGYGLPAAVALGLHTGEAVFGMAGPQGAQQFVAFGDCVSVAERLVHRARGRNRPVARRDESARRRGGDARRGRAARARARRQAPAAPDLRHGARDPPGLHLDSGDGLGLRPGRN